MIDLTIVIVNYNAGPALTDCLDSLYREMDAGLNLEVRLVDNASTDGSLARAAAGRPWVKVTANHYNFGFARAVNQALREATGRYWMLLNPDTGVKPGALPKLIAFAEDHPTAGAIGPRIIDPDGRIQYSARTAQGPEAFLFNRYSLMTRLWPDNPVSRRYLMSDWDHDQVAGGGLAVRGGPAGPARGGGQGRVDGREFLSLSRRRGLVYEDRRRRVWGGLFPRGGGGPPHWHIQRDGVPQTA